MCIDKFFVCVPPVKHETLISTLTRLLQQNSWPPQMKGGMFTKHFCVAIVELTVELMVNTKRNPFWRKMYQKHPPAKCTTKNQKCTRTPPPPPHLVHFGGLYGGGGYILGFFFGTFFWGFWYILGFFVGHNGVFYTSRAFFGTFWGGWYISGSYGAIRGGGGRVVV